MVRVTDYNNGLVVFNCDSCDHVDIEDISLLLEDDCVLKITPFCKLCGDATTLYFLRCVNEYNAKSLLADFENLKSKEEK